MGSYLYGGVGWLEHEQTELSSKARPKKIRDSRATIVGNWCGRANFFIFSLKIWCWIACTSLGPGVIKYRLPAKYRLPPPDTVSLMTFMYSFSMYMWRTRAWRLPSDSRGRCSAAGMKIEYERVWRVDQVNKKKKSRGGIFWCARARESRIFLVSPKEWISFLNSGGDEMERRRIGRELK